MHLGDRDTKRKRRKLFLKDEKDPRKSWKGGDQREYSKLQEYHKIAKITVIENSLDGGQNKYNQEIWKIKSIERPRNRKYDFWKTFHRDSTI